MTQHPFGHTSRSVESQCQHDCRTGGTALLSQHVHLWVTHLRASDNYRFNNNSSHCHHSTPRLIGKLLNDRFGADHFNLQLHKAQGGWLNGTEKFERSCDVTLSMQLQMNLQVFHNSRFKTPQMFEGKHISTASIQH